MIAKVLVALAAIALAGAALWRLGARRRSLPCPAWLAWMVELENPIARATHSAVIVRELRLAPGARVLDAGCGPGRVTVPLARAVGPGGAVVALDVQEGMLARARARVAGAGLANVEFVRAGLGDGALPQGAFDAAVLVTVLGEIPDRARALAELWRALRPGGVLSVTELAADPHFQRKATVRRLAAEAGFRERAVFGGGLAYTLHLERPPAA